MEVLSVVPKLPVVHTLGASIPALDEHAVSVCLPLWGDVVGYEEGEARVVNSMKAGYPRFRVNDIVALATDLLLEHYKIDACVRSAAADIDISAFIFPNASTSERFLSFMENSPNVKRFQLSGILKSVLQDFWMVVYPAAAKPKAKCYWQHSGEILSSRQAEHLLRSLALFYKDQHCYGPQPVFIPLFFNEGCTAPALPDGGAKQMLLDDVQKLLLRGGKLPAQAALERYRTLLQSVLHDYGELSINQSASTSSMNASESALNVHRTIKNRILSILNQPAVVNANSAAGSSGSTDRGAAESSTENGCGQCFLSVSGMSAIFTAFRLAKLFYYSQCSSAIVGDSKELEESSPLMVRANEIADRREVMAAIGHPKTVVFGFPYVDTLKIMQREEWNKGGVHFFPRGNDEDLQQLEALLASNQRSVHAPTALPSESCSKGKGEELLVNDIVAVFTEVPSNPLLNCPDMLALTRLSKKYGFLLIVDDTVASFANVDVFNPNGGVQADILCSSLTKIFCGTGNVMAGSLVLSSPATASRKPKLVRRKNPLPSSTSAADASLLSAPPITAASAASLCDSNSDSSRGTSGGASGGGSGGCVGSDSPSSGSIPSRASSFSASAALNNMSTVDSARLLQRLLDEMSAAADLTPLSAEDARVVELTSRTFVARSNRVNATALGLARYFEQHPAVESTYYPGLTNNARGHANYLQVMRVQSRRRRPCSLRTAAEEAAEGAENVYTKERGAVASAAGVTEGSDIIEGEVAAGSVAGMGELGRSDTDGDFISGEVACVEPGFGCLLSIVLHEKCNTPEFMDKLDLCKGPSLGTNFSLVCPYTLLAHYGELDWAASCGVSARLVRISVGLEDLAELIEKFEAAFAATTQTLL